MIIWQCQQHLGAEAENHTKMATIEQHSQWLRQSVHTNGSSKLQGKKGTKKGLIFRIVSVNTPLSPYIPESSWILEKALAKTASKNGREHSLVHYRKMW